MLKRGDCEYGFPCFALADAYKYRNEYFNGVTRKKVEIKLIVEVEKENVRPGYNRGGVRKI